MYVKNKKNMDWKQKYLQKHDTAKTRIRFPPNLYSDGFNLSV